MKLKLINSLAVFGIAMFVCGCAARQAQLALTARDQYETALSAYAKHHYGDAILAFQKVLFNYPGLSYVDSVQFWFAMSYYGNEEYHLAIAEFRRVITSFPNSELIDDAQFMIGKSYFDAAPKNVGLDQTDTENAIRELSQFLEDYPSSDRRKEGELMLSRAVEKMVDKQFRAGKQYYRMGNRQSARIYLEDIIKEHPESRFVPEALYLLARVDEKEGKYLDARDKLNNLILTFPNSELVTKAAQMKQKMESKIQSGVKVVHDSPKVTEKKSE